MIEDKQLARHCVIVGFSFEEYIKASEQLCIDVHGTHTVEEYEALCQRFDSDTMEWSEEEKEG